MTSRDLINFLLRAGCAGLVLFAMTAQSANNDLNLPELGGSSPATTSLAFEHDLGQRFLRAVRAQTPGYQDPLVIDYLEHLIFALAEHSDLEDRRLYITLIDNASINAFAAPGGVLGINHGLFLHAETQHEFSAILAHELAHLSQRHFARGIEASKKAGVISIAGLLAGVILAATAGSEAGIAAVTTSRGIASTQQLSYSRTRESEADRIGISTMTRANLDPRAMAYMFERLDRLNRGSGEQIPEFLRTHPVTRSRISDAYNQTESLAKKKWEPDFDYQLIRARVMVSDADLIQNVIKRFEKHAQVRQGAALSATQYGLALAYTKAKRFKEAKRLLDGLLTQYPNHIALELAQIERLADSRQLPEALKTARRVLAINPNNYPVSVIYARLLDQSERPDLASDVLNELVLARTQDDQVWYQLAESLGLANDIPGVHQARAEYFLLNGDLDGAAKQLGYALPLVRQNFQLSAKIKQRIDEIWALQDQSSQ
ncbi:M48 family metalloprotease [Pseudomonadales bacterium]|nr:M48 family metalloprotease [Pseudomonadales bacterium]